MKKTMSLILIIGLVSGYANSDTIDAARMEWTKAYLEKNGMPIPDGGIKIISANQMSSYAKMQKQRMQYQKDMQRYGYIKSINPVTDQLLNIEITSAHDYKNPENNFKPTNTHLKHNIFDLQMAYTYIGVPSDVIDENIGFAPYLTYQKGMGWVGAMQFFINRRVGNCVFSENNTKLSHGAIIIAQEDVRQDVNGKTTTVEVMGTPDTGFTYTVEWFDNIFFRKLECANSKYSTKIIGDVVDIAKRIDNYN